MKILTATILSSLFLDGSIGLLGLALRSGAVPDAYRLFREILLLWIARWCMVQTIGACVGEIRHRLQRNGRLALLTM